MSALGNTFDTTAPAGSDLLSLGDDQIRNDKAAIEERVSIEHYKLSSGLASTKEDRRAPGRARPGIIGVMGKGTTTERNAVSATAATPATIDGQTAYGPGVGALYWDTTLNTMLRWNGSTWDTLPSQAFVKYGTGYASNAYVLFDHTSSSATLANYLGSGSPGVQFSATQATYVSFVAQRRSDRGEGTGKENYAWGFHLNSASAVGYLQNTEAVWQVGIAEPPGLLNGMRSPCALSMIVPPAYYFRIRCFYSTSLTGGTVSEGSTFTATDLNTWFNVTPGGGLFQCMVALL